MADGFGNHAPDWEPTAKDVPADAPGLEAIAELGRVEALRPSQADMREAFGEPVDEGKTVRWSLDMRDAKNRGLYKELTQPHRRAEIERSMRWNAGMRRVQVRDPKTGKVDVIPEEQEERAGRVRGLRRVRPFARMSRVERGPDGMLFRYVAGWMPTGRTCLGTPLDPEDDGLAHGMQRDPDGGFWVWRELEWRALEAGEPLTAEEIAGFQVED